MKLRDGFITHNTDGKHMMVSSGNNDFNGLIYNNDTAAFIVECLKTEISKEEIVSKMLEKYDAKQDIISADVEKILNILRGIGAIDE